MPAVWQLNWDAPAATVCTGVQKLDRRPFPRISSILPAMKNPYHALLLLIAGATQKELAAQVRYLKIGLEIARSKLPQRVTITPQERNRLVKFGAKLGQALDKLVCGSRTFAARSGWAGCSSTTTAGRRSSDSERWLEPGDPQVMSLGSDDPSTRFL
jgi:hypothetical protein